MAAVLSPAFAETPEEIANKYPGYKLSFQDEFDKGEVPDENVWNFEIGMKRNHEDQCYMKENATIADGLLVIEARKERVKNPDYKRYSTDWKTKNQYCDYTSASIIAKDPNRFTYGVYEVKAKIPVGTGYWPAIWSTGNTYEWPYAGEIDVMEYYGDAIHANVAWGGNERWNAQWASKAPRMSNFEKDFADKFHIWKMEWDEEAIRIYLDDRLLNEVNLDRTVNPNPGQSWYNVDNYNPYRDPKNTHGVWLNLALGGDNGGSLTNTAFPAQYYVDYVRVYTPEGIYTPLKWQLSKAQEALDATTEGNEPGQYTAAARQALKDAMATAEALIDVTDEEGAKNGANALREAIKTYKASYNHIIAGEYRFQHVASNHFLSSGWKDEKNCILILGNNEGEGAPNKEYGQVFTLTQAPEGANVEGFNIKTVKGEYVYRDSWNLYVAAEGDASPKTKNYIFDVEFDGNYVHIKNMGSNAYFGTDDTYEWANVYSDKAGAGNGNGRFYLLKPGQSGVDNVYTEQIRVAQGVYNLQGIRIADTEKEILQAGVKGIFIVVGLDGTRKIAL